MEGLRWARCLAYRLADFRDLVRSSMSNTTTVKLKRGILYAFVWRLGLTAVPWAQLHVFVSLELALVDLFPGLRGLQYETVLNS